MYPRKTRHEKSRRIIYEFLYKMGVLNEKRCNKIVGNINLTAFYSTDVLQSISHLISTTSIMQNIEKYNKKDFNMLSIYLHI